MLSLALPKQSAKPTASNPAPGNTPKGELPLFLKNKITQVRPTPNQASKKRSSQAHDLPLDVVQRSRSRCL